jgi:PAS domain S-box-containing protein
LFTGDIDSELKDRALASATEGITISDPSLRDNPLIYVNSGFEAMTGYTAEDVLGKNCRFLQGPLTGKAASEEIRAAIAQDRPCLVELLNYRKDGSTFWNRLSITPVRDASGKTTHYIGVQSDITERKQAEDLLRQANIRLEAANRESKRGLNYAAGIQQAMLPSPIFEDKRFRIASRLISCDELAGDMLNYFILDDGRVGFYVLDVVGHGISAALMSVTISRLLSPRSGKSCLFESAGPKQKAARVLSPAEVGGVLNDLFVENIGSGQFFTIFYGIWDASAEQLTYFSAGHPPAVLLSADGTVRLLNADGFPVGITPFPEYVNHQTPFARGDRLFVFSDGLTDAADKGGQPLGLDGLKQLIAQRSGLSLQHAVDEIVDSVAHRRQRHSVKDDLTLLGFEAVR